MLMLKPALKSFIEVCRSGSFTKAAAKMYVTPSAVMQQMDSLEKEYGAKLFIRTHHGVRPTDIGNYLLEQAEDMMRRSEAVRSHLRIASEGSDPICFGTSIWERCRLLYDLWTLYSQQKPACRIEMVNISTEIGIPESVDLIESLNGGVPWMLQWDFHEICRVPIGIALKKNHPLADRELLAAKDLAHYKIGLFKDTSFDGIVELRRVLEDARAELIWLDNPSPSVFWECVFQHRLLLAPLCWSDILAGMTIRPVDWEFSIPYGIFSRPYPREAVSGFLRFIHDTYTGDNPDDLIPMLNY